MLFDWLIVFNSVGSLLGSLFNKIARLYLLFKILTIFTRNSSLLQEVGRYVRSPGVSQRYCENRIVYIIHCMHCYELLSLSLLLLSSFLLLFIIIFLSILYCAPLSKKKKDHITYYMLA